MKKNHEKLPLFTALQAVRDKKIIPFDVPGHKQGKGAKELKEYFGKTLLECDVNSMKPLDYLNNPTGVIKEAEDLLADAYGADHGYLLVNGTSSGVQAMVMAACSPGDEIIIPRNVHKSATNALILSGAIPVYIQPEMEDNLGIANGIGVEQVRAAIQDHPKAKAIFVINPTYYGTTSPLNEITALAHEHGLAVLVDEAHGAHFPFHKELPMSAMEAGADISAISLHKTGGSLSQSSGLLLKSSLIDADKVKAVLGLCQTTSASYILMSSIDVARRNLALHGEIMLEKVLDLTRYARTEINKIDGLYAFGCERIASDGVFGFDETKLGIKVSGIGLTGLYVYDVLRDEYNIQMEFGDIHNILAIISLGDTKEALNELIYALKDIKKKYGTVRQINSEVNLINPEVVVSPRDAFYSPKKVLPLKKSIGEIAGESVMTYPPGIPIVTPGERISQSMVEYIELLKDENTLLTGPADPHIDYIKVLY